VILNQAMVYDLTQGAPRRLPESDDTDMHVPNTIMPVVLALQTHKFFATGSVAVLQGSAFVSQDVSRLNQAAVSVALLTLGIGLWELELNLTTQFDYVGAVGTLNGAKISSSDAQGTTVNLISRLAAIGTFTDFNRMRFLLNQTCTLNLDVSITGAAQHLDARASVNCIRIL
jgi:hypothetical protein